MAKKVKWEAASEKIKIAIDLDDYADDIKEALKNAIERGLEAIGMHAVDYAVKIVPVITGRLKNSITFATPEMQGFTYDYKDDDENPYSYNVGKGVEDGTVYIGSSVEYAATIELGSSRRKETPYLSPAVTQHNAEYRDLIKDSLENA